MSGKSEMWIIEASGDGSRDSLFMTGTKEDARRALAEMMFFGTYEEACAHEGVKGYLESFDDEEAANGKP
jgi:hypothetical protein